MADLGFGLSGASGGAADALQEILKQKFLQQQEANRQTQLQVQNQQEQQKLQQQQQFQQAQMERMQAQSKAEADERASIAGVRNVEAATRLAPTLPMNQNVSPEAAGVLRTGGMGGNLFTPPTMAEGENGQTVANANPSVNLGTPQQQQAEQQRQALGKLITGLTPGSRERQALEYEQATGKPAPAGMFDKQASPTGTEDDQKYEAIVQRMNLHQPVSAEEGAFTKAYEQRKLLGPQLSNVGANTRQGTAEDFQIQQAGRKELTDTVEKPFRDAQAQASELRDIVTAAQAGNTFAASQQSLMGALATIRSAGLNRLPQAEIKAAGSAGSLWERIQGAIGHQVSGQSMSPDLQKDLLDYAKVLDTAAKEKYRKGFDAVTKRYKLTDERPLTGDTTRTRVTGPNGQTGSVPAGTTLPPGWTEAR